MGAEREACAKRIAHRRVEKEVVMVCFCVHAAKHEPPDVGQYYLNDIVIALIGIEYKYFANDPVFAYSLLYQYQVKM